MLLHAANLVDDAMRRRVEKRPFSDTLGDDSDSNCDSDHVVPADAKRARHAEAEDAGEPGAVDWMRLENFMCHANFEIEFGPHVNIITGANGSKSPSVCWLDDWLAAAYAGVDRCRV